MPKQRAKTIFSRKLLPNGFWTVLTVYILAISIIITALWGLQRQLFPDNEELDLLNKKILLNSFVSSSDSAENYINLGKYYFSHNKLKPAQEAFKIATQIEDSSPISPESARKDYTALIVKHANLKTSADFWEDQLEKTPNYRDAHIKLAEIYMQLGENKKTQEHLNLAKQIDPNYNKLKTGYL